MNERIIFLGTPELAAKCLKGLVEANFNIVGVVTKEDKIRGRHNAIEESPVAKMARELNLPLHKPHRLNTNFEFIKELKPDLLLTFAYGQLISDEILALGTYKPLNLHGSLLPSGSSGSNRASRAACWLGERGTFVPVFSFSRRPSNSR